MLLGVAAEAASFLAFAQVQRRLLRAGHADMPVGPMVAITLAANSIANSLPAGSVFAPVYSFRQFRRRGVDEALAGWSVVATFVTLSVALTLVAAIGASVAGAEGASLDLVELSCPDCGHRFDIIRAGRCLDEPELHLEPVPLLVDDSGIVKVALRAAVA